MYVEGLEFSMQDARKDAADRLICVGPTLMWRISEAAIEAAGRAR